MGKHLPAQREASDTTANKSTCGKACSINSYHGNIMFSQREANKKYYSKNKERILAAAKSSSKERYKANRAYFLRQVGAACEQCGWNSEPDVLQFDHTVPLNNEKAARFTAALRGLSINNPNLWNNFNDVRVLCPNCHAVKTQAEWRSGLLRTR